MWPTCLAACPALAWKRRALPAGAAAPLGQCLHVSPSLPLPNLQRCPTTPADCALRSAGTEFVEDRHVDRARLRSLPRGDVAGWSAIASRSAVRQAAPGEVLYLKGARFPGAEGRGAVHRSPQAPAAGPGAGPRLLLKLDPPAEGQGCGCAAHHH